MERNGIDKLKKVSIILPLVVAVIFNSSVAAIDRENNSKLSCGIDSYYVKDMIAQDDHIPVQAHFLASEGIPDVLEMVKNVQNRFNPDLKIAGILLTMYQSRPQLCQSVRNSVNDIYGESLHVFERPIEQTIKVAECPAAGMSILDYAPKNPAAESYRSLALEVLHLA